MEEFCQIENSSNYAYIFIDILNNLIYNFKKWKGMIKMNKIVTKCPTCGEEMYVVALKCPSCDTEVRGTFYLDEFFKLSRDQLNFIKLFIKNRGNLSDLGRELNLSYPTLRSRLNEIAKTLGYPAEEERIDKMEVLEKIEKGEITPQEAIKLLKGGGE